jgi:hypothetical protein
MVGLLGRGNALHGREATRSLLRYLCTAIIERRAGGGRTVPARQSIDRGLGNTQTGALRYTENRV